MNKKTILLITLIALSAIFISACEPVIPVASATGRNAASSTANNNAASQGSGNANGAMASAECDASGQANGGSASGNGHSGAMGMGVQAPAYAIGEISQAEADGLAFMREEEKLARDVYLSLYETWGLRPFSNIASSEQTHTDSVKALLAMYALPDPVVDDTIGVFVNADLQALYNDLVKKGNTSLVDALEVGAAIEEIDIRDLIDYMDNTAEANLEWVYANLEAGSENHLRAYVSQWEMQTGETYVPQYLSQAMYDTIMSASSGNGGGHGQGGHSNGNGGGQGNNG